jgi:hypothetical protein
MTGAFLCLVVAAVAAEPAGSAGVKAGGVYRVAFERSFGFTDDFDPTGEYYTFSWAIESNLMIRTLVGYDHVAGPRGNVLVPDLATSVPRPTDGGLTYTFHLKPGIEFGPPVSRPSRRRTCSTRSSGSRAPRTGRSTASTTRRSPASRPTARARPRRSPGSGRRTSAPWSST